MEELSMNKLKYGIPCLVCGQSAEISEWEAKHNSVKICPECIRAIKWARLQMYSETQLVLKGHLGS